MHLCVEKIWYAVVWDNASHHEIQIRVFRNFHFYHSYFISSVTYFPGTCTHACQWSGTLLQISFHGNSSSWLKIIYYLCKFLSSGPCLIMPRSLTKHRMEKKYNLLIKWRSSYFCFCCVVCHLVRMVSSFSLSYPSSPVPVRALSSMHIIILQ